MASKNSSLGKASKAKKDEFYTQLADVENELRHYKSFFKDKIVFCNCDDPFESNFVKYFAMNFNSLGLKKLIATCYATSPVMYSQLTFFGEPEPIGSVGEGKKPYKIEITEVRDENGDGAIDLDDFESMLRNNPPKLLQGDGDFRSDECITLLKEADVVVTNPPFSLFREYVAQLIEYDKKFIIIGNQNAITYKEIFTLLRDNKVWLGYKFGDMAFTVPDSYEPRETRFWIDENGQKWRSMGNICWYTNSEDRADIIIPLLEALFNATSDGAEIHYIVESQYAKTLSDYLYYRVEGIKSLEEKIGIELDEISNIVDIDNNKFNTIMSNFSNQLFGNQNFKDRFKEELIKYRFFNRIGCQPIFSVLICGASGIGKTEVARILHRELSPNEPVIKINFGNYSTQDALNSLIGSPRGYIGSSIEIIISAIPGILSIRFLIFNFILPGFIELPVL